MNKQEFITKLNGKLFLLNEKERRDIIEEYVEHITLKMQDGKSEVDAIKDFGDLDELAGEILEAYHIDNTKIQSKTMDTYIKQGVDYINKTTEKILSFNGSEIASLVVEFILIIIVLALVQIPFDMVASMLSGFFSWMPYPIYRTVNSILHLFGSLGSLALGLLILYNFINKRIFDKTPSFTKTSIRPIVKNKKGKEDIKVEKSQEYNPYQAPEAQEVEGGVYTDTEQPVNEENIDYTSYAAECQSQTSYSKSNVSHKASDSFVVNILIIILKVFAFFILWLPCAITTVVGIVLTVLSCVLFMGGIGFMGICIAGVGCCIIGISFTAWLTQIIMGGKKAND